MGVRTWSLIHTHRLCSRKGSCEYLEPRLRTDLEAAEERYSVHLIITTIITTDYYYCLSPVKENEIARACGMHWREMRCETLR